MPRFVLCTMPASREKKPSARRLSRPHTLGFWLGPMEARARRSGRGARPLLPRREAATISEPPGPNSSRSPEKLTPGAGPGRAQLWGEGRQSRRRLRAEIGQEKKPPSGLAGQTLSSSGPNCRHCNVLNAQSAEAVHLPGNVVPSVRRGILACTQNYNPHQAAGNEPLPRPRLQPAAAPPYPASSGRAEAAPWGWPGFPALFATPGEDCGGAVLPPLGLCSVYLPCTQGSVPCHPCAPTLVSPRLSLWEPWLGAEGGAVSGATAPTLPTRQRPVKKKGTPSAFPSVITLDVVDG